MTKSDCNSKCNSKFSGATNSVNKSICKAACTVGDEAKKHGDSISSKMTEMKTSFDTLNTDIEKLKTSMCDQACGPISSNKRQRCKDACKEL